MLNTNYAPSAGATACIPLTNCTDTEYQSTAPTTSTDRGCTGCTAGSVKVDATHCAPCPAGQYAEADATACSDCVSGSSYTLTTGQTTCSPASECGAGTYELAASTPTSDTVCDPCIPGTVPGEGVCDPCPINYFSSDPEIPCTECGTDQYTLDEGQTSCLSGTQIIFDCNSIPDNIRAVNTYPWENTTYVLILSNCGFCNAKVAELTNHTIPEFSTESDLPLTSDRVVITGPTVFECYTIDGYGVYMIVSETVNDAVTSTCMDGYYGNGDPISSPINPVDSISSCAQLCQGTAGCITYNYRVDDGACT